MTAEEEKAILEELLCPVCDQYMCPPIFLCVMGHSICEDCFKKVKCCPKCRAAKSFNARNYSLEGVYAKLNVPCKYANYGCPIILLGENIRKHHAFCNHARVHCPFRFYDNCQWNQSKSDLKNHLTKKHSFNFYQKDKQKFLSRSFSAIENYHYIYAVIFAHEQFFRLTWDLNESTGMTRWAVYYIGSPEEATKFSFKLEFCKDETSTSTSIPLAFKSICIAKPEREDQKFVEHHCFYVHKTLLRNYCTENGDLNYKVCIYSIKEQTKIDEPVESDSGTTMKIDIEALRKYVVNNSTNAGVGTVMEGVQTINIKENIEGSSETNEVETTNCESPTDDL